jgi:short subunit dehydrogenase-like uncharacterized protein
MTSARDLDIVVFGASGFVGRLLAGHLARAAPAGLRIGLAGRSADRLSAVRDGLGPRAADWPLVVADVQDAGSLAELAGRARVVATTVGPYLRYGLPLVAACATAGTDYVDLTGEVLFVRQSIDRWTPVAVESGARIVHACGFDSVPSELGCCSARAGRGRGRRDAGGHRPARQGAQRRLQRRDHRLHARRARRRSRPTRRCAGWWPTRTA